MFLELRSTLRAALLALAIAIVLWILAVVASFLDLFGIVRISKPLADMGLAFEALDLLWRTQERLGRNAWTSRPRCRR